MSQAAAATAALATHPLHRSRTPLLLMVHLTVPPVPTRAPQADPASARAAASATDPLRTAAPPGHANATTYWCTVCRSNKLLCPAETPALTPTDARWHQSMGLVSPRRWDRCEAQLFTGSWMARGRESAALARLDRAGRGLPQVPLIEAVGESGRGPVVTKRVAFGELLARNRRPTPQWPPSRVTPPSGSVLSAADTASAAEAATPEVSVPQPGQLRVRPTPTLPDAIPHLRRELSPPPRPAAVHVTGIAACGAMPAINRNLSTGDGPCRRMACSNNRSSLLRRATGR